MRRRIVGLFVLLLFISSIGSTAVLAAPTKPDIQVGTSVLSIDEAALNAAGYKFVDDTCLLYTSPSPRDGLLSRMPSSA